MHIQTPCQPVYRVVRIRIRGQCLTQEVAYRIPSGVPTRAEDEPLVEIRPGRARMQYSELGIHIVGREIWGKWRTLEKIKTGPIKIFVKPSATSNTLGKPNLSVVLEMYSSGRGKFQDPGESVFDFRRAGTVLVLMPLASAGVNGDETAARGLGTRRLAGLFAACKDTFAAQAGTRLGISACVRTRRRAGVEEMVRYARAWTRDELFGMVGIRVFATLITLVMPAQNTMSWPLPGAGLPQTAPPHPLQAGVPGASAFPGAVVSGSTIKWRAARRGPS
ncbi:hypothetical protein B0H17DRAFT_1184045 [Mycena rosella]|uniref:Uncharacterized protein n=1 Tax=Mycena rosella TaxID=1033263 RepID=A0AAD7CWZ3_MYCRO|nr:hypothetical protein B0H17DRAFT_1184045 [Mycena rosella]